MSAFTDMLEEVTAATLLNPDFYARPVTLKMGTAEITVDVHLRYTKRYEPQPDGTRKVIDQVRATVAKSSVSRPFEIGDRLILAEGEAAYLYTGNDHDTPVCWKPVFERPRITSQGTRPRG